MAWRKAPGPPRDPAVAVLLAAEQEAAAAGDAGRLAAARSWIHLLACTGGDPEVAGLFAVLAREDTRGVA